MAINVKDKLVTLESLGVAYSAEQDAREEADQALSTRIDNIVAPDGDPSLTEVSDARVSGSTTYNTLKARLDADKAAIGTEISQLSADLEDLDERVEALENASGGDGLTADIKSALLACFRNVVFTNDEDDYYQDLYDALYNKTLVGLEVSYLPSDVVFDTDTLDSLKNDLIVTAVYDDRTREILPSNEYTLSGTLDATPSVVTVRRNNVTTTFDVTVVPISQMTESVMISGYDSRNASNTASAGPYCLKINDVYIYDYSAYITGIKLKVQTAGILHIDVIPSSVVENNRVTDEWASRVNKAVITTTSTGEQTVYFDRPFAIPNGYCLVIGRGTNYGDDTCIWKYGSYGTQKGFCWHSGSSDKSLGIDVIIKGGAS